MLRTLAALGLLLPGLALAQIIVTETSDFPNGDDEIINIDECEGDLRSSFVAAWNISVGTGAFPTGQLRISNTNTCPENSQDFPNAVTETWETITQPTGSSRSRSAESLATTAGYDCTEQASIRTIYVCAVLQAATTPVGTQQAIIRVDTSRPTPPLVTAVSPGNGALDVSWEASSGADRYRVRATPPTGNPVLSSETTDTSKRITGLTNGTTYVVDVLAFSIGGNQSLEPTTQLQGTPTETDDFWRYYQKQPAAQEAGGCSTTGAGGLALLALGAVAARLRRGGRS
jgi:hypothetical protein